jgi:DNA-directed RNA polymerase specialized sigma24 family protein
MPHETSFADPTKITSAAEAAQKMNEVVDGIAAELYGLSTMLAGEGEESVQLVEKAVAEAEVSACQNPIAARNTSRRALCREAVSYLAARDAASFAAPAEGEKSCGCCLGEDEMESAGVSQEELSSMLAGPERIRVRQWLSQLLPALRVVFVLRAVAGYDPQKTAEMLVSYGGPQAAGWTADAVRHTFRQGLCSLTSQLLHATAKK